MFYNYNNTPIYYTITGAGKTLVLLHGLMESSTMWQDTIAHFKDTHQVIAIDLPGFGQSGNLSDTHTMELMARIVAEILKTENIASASFIGHSMGGYVSLALAENFPEMTDALILLHSTTTPDTEIRKKNRDRAIQILQKNKDAYVSMAISNLFTKKARDQFLEAIQQVKEEALSFSAAGIAAAHLGMRDRKDRTSVLANFSKQKLIIAGIDDQLLPINDAKYISKITNTPLKIIDAGHMSWIENKEEMLNSMLLND
ncbi:hydrolase of the alpha/beta superfamily protein [unidentified eubacterium SCB49]|nr:hydrolase of the alpha/beta superfamily protein [unidentified eubacterium SCB49]